MASFKALCLAGVASLAATVSASAADLLLPPPPPPVPALPPVEVGSGWYLRGDAGAGALQLRNSISTFTYNPPGFADEGYSASEQAIIGAGVGYKINHFFRADITGEYRFGSRYQATELATGCNFPGGPCADGYRGSISSGVVLVNAYADLGTWYGVTPYVGAGVGASFNTFSGVTDYNYLYFGQAAGSSQSNTHVSLAYALMAGVAYDITPNLKLDIGYRYLDMGRASTAPIICYNAGGCTNERQNYHLSSHDVRIGLRYMFTDFVPQRYPVIARY